MRRPGRRRAVAVAGALLAGLLLVACDEGGSPVVEPEPGGDTTSTSAGAAPSSTEPGAEAQPALWPSPVVAFATPEEVAADFVEQVVGAGVPGEFRAGDARSGEIDVLFQGEGGGAEIVRSTLLVRQLGPDDGWFVIAAINPNAAITTPSAGAEVPAGLLTVEGLGRGFEGTVVVRALAAGEVGEPLAEVVTAGGAQADPEPFTVELDLSGAQPGQVVTLLVSGDTGHESDPGDFGAIPVVVAG